MAQKLVERTNPVDGLPIAALLLSKASVLVAAAMLVIASDTGAQEHNGPGIQNAAEYFQLACAACHGVEGKGDGPAATQLKSPPADLTKISKRRGGIFPFREVYDKIEGLAMPTVHGTRDMPIWGAVLLYQELGTSVSKEDARNATHNARKRLEALVAYLESIQQ
jgi:mono/diheme cytochrome c family protein